MLPQQPSALLRGWRGPPVTRASHSSSLALRRGTSPPPPLTLDITCARMQAPVRRMHRAVLSQSALLTSYLDGGRCPPPASCTFCTDLSGPPGRAQWLARNFSAALEQEAPPWSCHQATYSRGRTRYCNADHMQVMLITCRRIQSGWVASKPNRHACQAGRRCMQPTHHFNHKVP